MILKTTRHIDGETDVGLATKHGQSIARAGDGVGSETGSDASMSQRACSGCPNAHQCRDVWGRENCGPLAGAWLLLGSVIAFLLPLVIAIVAGAIVHATVEQDATLPIWDILAAGCGLVVGGVLGWVVMPAIRKRFAR